MWSGLEDMVRAVKRGFMRVKIKFSEDSLFFKDGTKEEIYTNITEIHFNYDGLGRIAFESDIDVTGNTFDIADIKEFETDEEVVL